MIATSLRRPPVRRTTLFLAITFGLGLILILLWALSPSPAALAGAADMATGDRGPSNSLKHRMSGDLGDAMASGQSADLPPGVTAAWWAAVQEQILQETSFSGPWTRTGEYSNDRFGWSVASAGDVNGDGYADVIVGAPYYDVTPDNDEGKVYVYAGTSSGPGTTPLVKLTGANPDDNFGFCVGSAGDVNGDGYGDVIVGAYHHNDYQGAAYVYHGTSTGLNLSPSFTATGEHVGDRFGYSAATAGDVNGDGYADVVIGAHFHSGNAGALYVYYGSSTGVTHSGVFSKTGDGGEYLGASVATAGDVNGDGYADVIVGAFGYDSNRGRVYVGYGSSSGLNGTDVFSTAGEYGGDYFGLPVATAGDVNGDGYADVVVGASYYGSGRGAVYIYHGGTVGLSETGVFSVTGDDEDDWFGYSAATAGDVNGDGYADLVVGAYGHLTDTGKVYVYQGGTGGLSATPTFTATGESQGDRFGASVACSGDVNGDGFAGIVIGANGNSDSASYAGKAYVYYGAGDSLSATPTFTASGEGADDNFGTSVATAGDVNGDGFTDVIVGTPYYVASPALSDTGRVYVYEGGPTGLGATPAFSATGAGAFEEFGYSAATAGDVNGDGYADVVVGALGYDGGRGRVLVYHGSSAGLGVTPAFTATGEVVGDEFGGAVASAGDVNGDGYADVIVGAPYHDVTSDNAEGKVYVYYGTSTGLTTTGVYSTSVDEMFAYLGATVASAGDVNGDGYADVVACASRYLAPGRVYVYHGSSDGLGTTYAVSFTNGITEARFGKSLATAGDVNGDGYADVVIGAESYMTDTGQAYVFYGSGSGLKATPAFTLTGEGEHDRFGRSVATAGDVNGDGYADVVVGAYGYDGSHGRVYVFHGGPSGLSWTDVLSITGQSSSAYLGYSVATAGDVNGDAFADVVVGSPYASADRGGVTVYRGGGGGGRLVRLRQTRSASDMLVQPWGTATTLYVRLNATSPMGRSRVKLQVEACPPGVPFGDAGCVLHTSSAWEDTTADAYGVSLKEAIGGLSPETLYRWRARLLYAPYSVTEAGITPPPNPAHGPWRRLFGQGLEADMRAGQGVFLPLVLRSSP